MATTFPIALADFFDGLRISSMTFTLGENFEMSETGAGEILSSQRGVRLWSGEVSLTPGKASDLTAIEAKIDLLRRPGASFFIGDPFYQDQGGGTTTVSSRDSAREMTLVAGATVNAGDHLHIELSGGRFSYHRVVAVDGVQVEVVPDLPASVSSGDTVDLDVPQLKAVMVPGSFSPPSLAPGRIVQGASFRWVQTLA
jgi:hypothetical protein